MFEIIFVATTMLVAIAIASIFIVLYRQRGPSWKDAQAIQKTSSVVYQSTLPENLGIRSEYQNALKDLLLRLENAIDGDYKEKIKARVMAENQFTPQKFEWLFFEMKRYLILTAIMKKAPMFSNDVDEIWHQMLMFTAEYQQFCDRYVGQMIHHSPNVGGQVVEGERALFDWTYSHLFDVTRPSWNIWGDFFTQPLQKSVLARVQDISEREQLKRELFNTQMAERHYGVESAIVRLVATMINEVANHQDLLDRYRTNARKASPRYNAQPRRYTATGRMATQVNNYKAYHSYSGSDFSFLAGVLVAMTLAEAVSDVEHGWNWMTPCSSPCGVTGNGCSSTTCTSSNFTCNSSSSCSSSNCSSCSGSSCGGSI